MADDTLPTASVGDIDSFITLLRSACSDELVHQRLEKLLSMPDERRRTFIQKWVGDLVIQRAPVDFIRAIACLLDDRVAEKAYEVIYRCERPGRASAPFWFALASVVSVLGIAAWKLIA
ncbi:hypothetical protein [Ramlibacter sp.]|uniref:hypothetical protein n=1 Tax=Ramlibacter sp. TaxID=1917967 RepID=UPI003D10D6ED